MTETEKKALALVNEVRVLDGRDPVPLDIMTYQYGFIALLRAIEQHEAFKREVSKAITDLTYIQHQYTFARGEVMGHLEKFVLKEPVDPLVEVMQDWWDTDGYASIETFRAAIEARGGRIMWEGE